MLADVALMFLRLYPNSLHNILPFLAWKRRLAQSKLGMDQLSLGQRPVLNVMIFGC